MVPVCPVKPVTLETSMAVSLGWKEVARGEKENWGVRMRSTVEGKGLAGINELICIPLWRDG